MLKFLLPALLFATAVSALATGVSTSCTGQSVDSYQTTYGVPAPPATPPTPFCSIGILDYSNFAYYGIQNAPGAASLELTPSGQGFSLSAVNGQPISAAPGQTVEFALYYDIVIDPAPIIAGADGSITEDPGNVKITQYFCNDSYLDRTVPPSCGTGTLQDLTVTTANPTKSITFHPPADSFEQVGIIFTLTGGKDGASFESFSATSDVIGAVPEPASIGLVGLVLAASGLMIRKSRKK